MDNEKILYSLNIEDAQRVATEHINRELTKHELGIIDDFIAEQIDWYSAISCAIDEMLKK